MAASAATASSSVGLCPNYAVICSFLERYGALLDLPELTFPQLERYLQDTSSVPKLLVDLHVKLLRKIGKSVSADRWEKYLVKVCQEFNTTWAWELEHKGYKEMQTDCKAAILKYLCECQFDENVKFKTAINEEDADQMRIQPIGRDKDGQMYWFQLDQEDNVRVYVEEQDDLDGSSWKCIVKNRNDLAEVVALLKTQIDPELLKREQEQAEAEEKTEVKTAESSSDEDSKDDVTSSTSPKTSQKVPSSAEAAAGSEEPAADVGVSNNQPLIKTEPLDVSDSRTSKDSSAVSIKTENGEEAKTNGEVKKSSVEEMQQVLKSQQQAKIPLKKRGMKFSEDFDRSLLVQNASLKLGDQCPTTEPAGKRPSLNEHVNGDVQPEAALQSGPKPSEVETLQQKTSPPEEVPAAAPPSPKRSGHQCEDSLEEHTLTEGPSLSGTEAATTEMEEGLTDSRGEEENTRDKEAPPSTPPPSDPDTAGSQKDSSREAETTGRTTETSCREAPEKEESPEEQMPHSTDAGGGGAGGGGAAPEQETVQASDQATPPSEGSSSAERAGEGEEPAEPEEADLKPASTNEEEHKRLSSGNTNENENTQPPHPDPPADTNEEEEDVDEEKQSKAEEHVSERASDVHEETEHQNKEDVQTEESGEASNQGGTSPGAEAVSHQEVLNGGEAPPGSQATSKRALHRRRAQVQAEDWPPDAESDGRCLRRSPRISRPATKTGEVHDRSSQNSTPAEKEEEEEKSRKDKEEEEEEEVKATQKKPREKKAEQEGQTKSKGRKRRKVRWSNTRTHRKKRSSEDEASNPESSEDEETEEEDDSDEDYKVEGSRRRRRRNRERRSSDSSTSSDDELPPNDDPCKHCGLPNHPELILLCDCCDSGYHTACLRPPLMVIPDGEWFCPPCQHKQLCDKLQEQLQNLDAALKKKERAERRKERLIYVGISVENIITPSVEEEPKPEIIKEKKEVKKMKSWGRRSTRTKKSISYRFDEFDEAIEEAIEEDVKEAEGGGAGRGKDMSNITGHRGKDMSAILQAEDGKENGQMLRASAGQRRKKRRRLNDLDSDSTVDEEESEEEFCLSESSEEEFIASDNESEAESAGESNHSEGSEAQRAAARIRILQQRRHSSRKRQRPSWYSDDEEEESGEDEEEEIATEGSSEFSDGDLDMSRRRSRRSHKAQVNYRETSESEGSQAEANRPRLKARRRRDSSDSEVSFSGDSEDESRGKRRAGSSEEDSRERRRRLALKRRRASEEDNSDDSSGDSSEEEDRPIRKRVNRIDSDDEDEDTWSQKGAAEKADEESKVADAKLGQGGIKSPEGQPPAPARDLLANMEPPKAAALAPNGVSGADGGQDEDEDDLLGVTDLVDYVCNNEDL